MSNPSLRELARKLGLSHTTVSEALRDSPRVRPETRQRVLSAAEDAGYRRNPLAGALMSEMRRSRTGTFRGVLAVLDLDGPERRPGYAVRFHEELARGARERAHDLGFKAEPLVIGQRGISEHRLDTILQSRGIRGILILPVSENPDISRLEWARYAGIYADYIIEKPALDSVCSDHFRSMVTALQRLHALGYRRPGLVLQYHHDERVLHRWEASFRAYQEHHNVFEPIPPEIVPEITREAFIRWFKSTRPDVVVCHRAEAIAWMAECGATVPETHGFCCLNVTNNVIPCAGLDLQPSVIGARGIELLIGQLFRNEYGVPAKPSTTTIPGMWVEGATLRSMSAA
jgi:LacI family transcriptional regulator